MKSRSILTAVAGFILALVWSAPCHADKAWDQYLNLDPNQKAQYKPAEQNRKRTVDGTKKDREATTDNLAAQVLANSGDAAVQPVYSQVMGENKTINDADEAFWRTISGFLAPTQVAKIFLKWHKPKEPGNPTTAKQGMPNPAPAFNWNDYFGLNKDQLAQLKAADKARGETMRTDKENFGASLTQLDQQVQSNGGDSAIQMTLTTLFSTMENQHRTEEDFWATNLPGFMSATQVAKIYLHRHPPKSGFNPPPQVVPVAGSSH